MSGEALSAANNGEIFAGKAPMAGAILAAKNKWLYGGTVSIYNQIVAPGVSRRGKIIIRFRRVPRSFPGSRERRGGARSAPANAQSLCVQTVERLGTTMGSLSLPVSTVPAE